MEDSHRDECKAPANAFLQLRSNQHRRQALEDLAGVLTHQHIRELRSLMGKVDFRCDVIAKLPFEIISIIMQHLPLYQVFQYQRVSWKWHNILSSPAMSNSLFGSWYRGPDTGLCLRDSLSPEAVASLKAEHVDAFSTGNAFSMMEYPLKDSPYISHECAAYAEGIFAWIDSEDQRLCRSLDLRTGYRKTFMTEERCELRQIAVSALMIVATGFLGKCYIWSFRDGMGISLRMPSAGFDKLMVSGDTLAVEFRPESTRNGMRVEVITWNLDSRTTHSFFLMLGKDYTRHKYESKTMLDSKRESFILCERIQGQKSGEVDNVHFTRTSLTGEVQAQGVLQLPPLNRHEDLSGNISSVQANRSSAIWFFVEALYQDDAAAMSQVIRIRYDFNRDQLELDTHLINGLDVSLYEASTIFTWKDVAYLWVDLEGWPTLKVIDCQNSICTDAPMAATIKGPPDLTHDGDVLDFDQNNYSNPLLLGDETFIISLFESGIFVWCFDKNIEMAYPSIQYKEKREQDLLDRLQKKQTVPTPRTSYIDLHSWKPTCL